MATIAKRRARKLTDAGKASVGYANIAMPMLRTNKHITIDIGEHTIRIELSDAEILANDILQRIREFS